MVDKIIAALLFFVLLTCAASAQIYTWTDKNGKVHFSDQPFSEDAQEIEVKQKNNIKPQTPKPQSSDWLAPSPSANKDQQQDASPASGGAMAGPSCAWIKGELAKAKRDFNSKDELTAKLSRRFAADYEMALKQNKCR